MFSHNEWMGTVSTLSHSAMHRLKDTQRNSGTGRTQEIPSLLARPMHSLDSTKDMIWLYRNLRHCYFSNGILNSARPLFPFAKCTFIVCECVSLYLSLSLCLCMCVSLCESGNISRLVEIVMHFECAMQIM